MICSTGERESFLGWYSLYAWDSGNLALLVWSISTTTRISIPAELT